MSDMGTEVSELTVTEFVTARLDEDELVTRERVRTALMDDALEWDRGRDYGGVYLMIDPARVLAQCAAMRKIVEMAAWAQSDMERLVPQFTGVEVCVERKMLGALASIWSDHPDFREEWR